MTHLVIGGNGLIGSALVAELRRRDAPYLWTTRRSADGGLELDLRAVDAARLPSATVVYLVAALPNFQAAQCGPDAWLVNVDAPIALAKHYCMRTPIGTRRAELVVFISSDAVEWCPGTELARQKAHVESFIHIIDGAIVRPARVTKETVGEFARFVIDIGVERRAGVSRWRVDPKTLRQAA